MVLRGGSIMNATVETIDGGSATLSELRRVGMDALVKALGPVGMARFLQQFEPGYGDYAAERQAILGDATVDDLMDEIARGRETPSEK
jgi:hypothetical protein